MVKLVFASDHAGVDLKAYLTESLDKELFEFVDLGPGSTDSVDYPDYAHPLAKMLETEAAELGILICGSGNGVCMTANKYQGVRAALCWQKEIAELARQHNNANVMCIPARFVSPEKALEMMAIFLNTPFEGGRHKRRVDKIAQC